MSICTSCGSTVAGGTRFCNRCGNPIALSELVETPNAKTIEVMPAPVATWYVTFATGQRGGPFTEDAIQSMIAQQQIKITDSVVTAGGTT